MSEFSLERKLEEQATRTEQRRRGELDVRHQLRTRPKDIGQAVRLVERGEKLPIEAAAESSARRRPDLPERPTTAAPPPATSSYRRRGRRDRERASRRCRSRTDRS
jgi:hypothetical protein